MRIKSILSVLSVLFMGLLVGAAFARDNEAGSPDEDYSVQEDQAKRFHSKVLPAFKVKQDDTDEEVKDEDVWNAQRKAIGNWPSGWSTEDDKTWHSAAPKDWPAEWKNGWGKGWSRGWGSGWSQGWGNGNSKKAKTASKARNKPAR